MPAALGTEIVISLSRLTNRVRLLKGLKNGCLLFPALIDSGRYLLMISFSAFLHF